MNKTRLPVLATLLLAGCGGSETSTKGDAARDTKAASDTATADAPAVPDAPVE